MRPFRLFRILLKSNQLEISSTRVAPILSKTILHHKIIMTSKISIENINIICISLRYMRTFPILLNYSHSNIKNLQFTLIIESCKRSGATLDDDSYSYIFI